MSLEQAQNRRFEENEPLTVAQALADACQASKHTVIDGEASPEEQVQAAFRAYTHRLYWKALGHVLAQEEDFEAMETAPLQEFHIRDAREYLANQKFPVRARQAEEFVKEFELTLTQPYKLIKHIGKRARRVADTALLEKFLIHKPLQEVDY